MARRRPRSIGAPSRHFWAASPRRAALTDVRAASFTVTRTDDTERGACAPGDCSLREAIEAANAVTTEASTITLPAGMYVLSIAHRLSMTQQITITRRLGHHHRRWRSAGGVFDTPGTDEIDRRHGPPRHGHERGAVAASTTAAPSPAPTSCWTANTTNGPGGGLFNEGTAYLIQSVLRNNMAATGGGFSNTGFISVPRSFTIDGNTSTAEGGGVRKRRLRLLDNTNPPTPPGPATGGGTSPPIPVERAAVASTTRRSSRS